MKRKRINQRRSRKVFHKTAKHTKHVNHLGVVSRGGIRW